mmetsp:Transcript_24259/g.52338  ORF Transcript_24259/g.52338 Transcript_24259/m.52338 type:complete len:223 (+) Transcript_24259:282-950(+)
MQRHPQPAHVSNWSSCGCGLRAAQGRCVSLELRLACRRRHYGAHLQGHWAASVVVRARLQMRPWPRASQHGGHSTAASMKGRHERAWSRCSDDARLLPSLVVAATPWEPSECETASAAAAAVLRAWAANHIQAVWPGLASSRRTHTGAWRCGLERICDRRLRMELAHRSQAAGTREVVTLRQLPSVAQGWSHPARHNPALLCSWMQPHIVISPRGTRVPCAR